MHVTTWLIDEVTNKCKVLRVMPYSIRRKAIDQLGPDAAAEEDPAL